MSFTVYHAISNHTVQIIGTGVVRNITPDEADELADKLKAAAAEARKAEEEDKPWDKAPVGSYALIGTYRVVAHKSNNREWFYIHNGGGVAEESFLNGFTLLKEVDE